MVNLSSKKGGFFKRRTDQRRTDYETEERTPAGRGRRRHRGHRGESGIPAYAARWDIANGDITNESGRRRRKKNKVSQGETIDKDDTNTVITGESDKNTVTIDTSEGNVDVTFDDLKIDVSGKKEGDGSDDSPVRESNAAVTVKGDHDAAIELDGDNELKSGDYNAGLEKNGHESEGTLTIKDDKGKDGSLTAEGGFGGAGIGGGIESTGSNITIRGGTIEAVGGSNAAGIGDGAGRASDDTDDSNPGDLYICGDAEVTAKAGSQMTDAKAPAIGGSYGEVPTENLSDDEHKVTGGRLTRLNADGTVMEGMGYDYTSTPKPQPDDDEDDDDDDVPPPGAGERPRTPARRHGGGRLLFQPGHHPAVDLPLVAESSTPTPQWPATPERSSPRGVWCLLRAPLPAPPSPPTSPVSGRTA